MPNWSSNLAGRFYPESSLPGQIRVDLTDFKVVPPTRKARAALAATNKSAATHALDVRLTDGRAGTHRSVANASGVWPWRNPARSAKTAIGDKHPSDRGACLLAEIKAGVISQVGRHAQSDLHTIHYHKRLEFPDIPVPEEKAAREGFVVGHRRHYDDEC